MCSLWRHCNVQMSYVSQSVDYPNVDVIKAGVRRIKLSDCMNVMCGLLDIFLELVPKAYSNKKYILTNIETPLWSYYGRKTIVYPWWNLLHCIFILEWSPQSPPCVPEKPLLSECILHLICQHHIDKKNEISRCEAEVLQNVSFRISLFMVVLFWGVSLYMIHTYKIYVWQSNVRFIIMRELYVAMVVTNVDSCFAHMPSTWINFNPCMDKYSQALSSEGWNYLSMTKIQRFYRWLLVTHKWLPNVLPNVP